MHQDHPESLESVVVPQAVVCLESMALKSFQVPECLGWVGLKPDCIHYLVPVLVQQVLVLVQQSLEMFGCPIVVL